MDIAQAVMLAASLVAALECRSIEMPKPIEGLNTDEPLDVRCGASGRGEGPSISCRARPGDTASGAASE